MEEATLIKKTPVNAKNKKLIHTELQVISDSMVKACEALDFDSFIQWFHNSADFIYVDTHGAWMSFQQYYSLMRKVFDAASNIDNSPIENKVVFLPGNSILTIWTGSYDISLKSGLSLCYNKLICTSLFKKIDNKWRIVFRQESKYGFNCTKD